MYIVSGSIEQNDQNDIALLAGPDATAAATIMQSLRNLYDNSIIKHYYATKQYLAIFNEYIVSVGGPLHNPCTKAMLENITKEIYFDENDSLMFFGKAYSKSTLDHIDYGLIVRHTNPYSTIKKVIILAGCGSHGVLAASMLFESSQSFKELNKSFKKKRGFLNNLLNNDFFGVVKCNMTGNEVSNIIIVDLKAVKRR
ncbi:MAG: hypothetical protein PF482_09555 [Desulfobacteraceae bacterium]|nr:hypothetical protein [Desulfobacteraceae bacterium]